MALRNVALCLPQLDESARRALVRQHFGWLARSLLERGLLWYTPVDRLKRLIQVDGDIGFAERSGKPVMWLVPHFVALDVAGVATQLFQKRLVASIYQAQSNPVFDAAMRRGRLRFEQGDVFARSERALPLVRAIRRGHVFFNLPDMDFGAKDAAFVPFFGVPAATLLAPARMARSLGMTVQPVVAELLPGGQGYKVHFLPPWDDFPGDEDDEAATCAAEPLDRRPHPRQPGAVPVGAQALQDPAAGPARAVLTGLDPGQGSARARQGGQRPWPPIIQTIMRLTFTKMHGAGNDFVVLDATRAPIQLSTQQLRLLGDRRFGVGADQILLVEPSTTPGVDFRYRIFNNTGDEVEHCGNGARCFVRFVHDQGLSQRKTIKVETVNNLLELQLQDDGRVTVDMNRPIFDLTRVPFDANGLTPRVEGGFELWPLAIGEGRSVEVAVLSMGNPHAVQRVADVREAPVAALGPMVEQHARFCAQGQRRLPAGAVAQPGGAAGV